MGKISYLKNQNPKLIQEHCDIVDKAKRDRFSKKKDFMKDMLELRSSKINHKIILYSQSVLPEYYFDFINAFDIYYDENKENLKNQNLLAFTEILCLHQSKFFQSPKAEQFKSKFIQAAGELTSTCSYDFETPLKNYATLIDLVKDKKLDLYVESIKKSKNQNFTTPLSNGLVGVLMYLSLPRARIFINETYELFNHEDGLFHATDYITRKTEAATQRFFELQNE